ncbi:MAG: Sir2 family NAD-dependent protein deacetylase [Desulfobacterales bacterium]|jgi:NAD-dependent SIR2 family protein deacetylase
MTEKIDKIANKIAEGGKNIVFTGAGISTESGISDYRSKGGIWDKFRPVYFDEFMSSLLVQPAAHMPFHAKRNGAFLAIVNLSETPCDDLCEVLIREPAGTVLPAIAEAVLGKS